MGSLKMKLSQVNGLMTCNEVRARDLVKQYLSGHLAEDDANAYEIHYMECQRCFGDLETARYLRKVLTRARAKQREPFPPAKTWLLWMAPIAVAGAIGVMAAMIWQHSQELPQSPVAQHVVLRQQ